MTGDKGKREIVIINQSTGYLTVDVCNAFADIYSKVHLLVGRVKEFYRPLKNNVDIVPIEKYDKSSILKRLKTWMVAALQIRKYLKKVPPSTDVLYFTNPPLSYLWADRLPHRFGIVEYDIYPDALSNVKCPQMIMRWWTNRNKSIFAKAVGIITLSDGMKQQLTKYVSCEKIRVVPNWGADENAEIVSETKNPFVKLNNLQDKFVVMYSGNIGYTHNVETIINVAEEMRNDSKVVFLIIGEGGKKESLIQMVKEKNLTNVIFSGYLPAEELKYSMSCAKLGMVTLTKETAKVSVPSKTYNLLSYGIPLLSISPPDSELGKIIQENGCGSSFEPESVKDIVAFISECISNDKKYLEYRSNALKTSKLYTRKNASEYTAIFKKD